MQENPSGVTRWQLSIACGLTATITYLAVMLTLPRQQIQSQSQSVVIQDAKTETVNKIIREKLDGLRSP